MESWWSYEWCWRKICRLSELRHRRPRINPLAIMSFPMTLSISAAKDSKQSSNYNTPIETIESHFDGDTKQLAREHSNVFELGKRIYFNDPNYPPWPRKELDTHTLEDGREEC